MIDHKTASTDTPCRSTIEGTGLWVYALGFRSNVPAVSRPGSRRACLDDSTPLGDCHKGWEFLRREALMTKLHGHQSMQP